MAFVCKLCPRRCGVLRGDEAAGAGRGYCRMGEDVYLARAALHFDEEPVISGVRGSGTVFFSGCALGCVFCQNFPISHDCLGARVKPGGLRGVFENLIAQGAHNINLVNPTHYVHAILRALDTPLPVPVVYNSGGYERVETLRALEGKVDVYLPDLKYMDEGASARYSGAGDYFEYASAALLEMARQQPKVEIGPDGVIRRGLIVRHLILPGHTDDSMRVLDWIAQNLSGAWVSLMAQYLPMYRAAEYPKINRPVTENEYNRVVDHLMDLGLEEGFLQELSSADEAYIPAFDLTGVPGAEIVEE